MRYFFLSAIYVLGGKTESSNFGFAIEGQYPTLAQLKNFIEDAIFGATEIVVVGITELSEGDYQTLFSEF